MISLIPDMSETLAYLSPQNQGAPEGFAQILQAVQSRTNPAPAPSPPRYVVQPGDHLWGIAKKLGYANPLELARFNNLKDPNRLQVGQVLQLPPKAPSPSPSDNPSPPPAIAALPATGKQTMKRKTHRDQASLPTSGLGEAASTSPDFAKAASRNAVIVLASWYGDNHHGKLMANGQPFDMYADTVAHPHLPLGTRLRLTNPQTGRSVVVQVTDRGPFISGRTLDLSYGVARKLGVVKAGITRLVMEKV